MKSTKIVALLVLPFLIWTCSANDSFAPTESRAAESTVEGGGVVGQGSQSGLITAAEWNDLTEWSFWENLLNNQDYAAKPQYWSFFTKNRIAVHVQSSGQPTVDIPNVEVVLKKEGEVIWSAKTDNAGRAELWAGLFDNRTENAWETYSLWVDSQRIAAPVKSFAAGVNEIRLGQYPQPSNEVELAFIVDATGSMGDELEFLKDDLQDVIQRVELHNPSLQISTGTVFYRDQGDDYVVRSSPFTGNFSETQAFIEQQKASGGGDFPEAVHTALKTAVEDLQWSESAKTRIAFLVLDAPPHHKSQVIEEVQRATKMAAEKGIRIIPVTASGIDKDTEFLMRFLAIATNGTYVFITDDSGIGNDHLEASVGAYQVELLNELMIRLIKKYTD